MEITIEKIKVNDAGVKIQYLETIENGSIDTRTIASKNPPLQGLTAVLKALRSDVALICDFEKSDEKHITVIGVSWGKGVVITAEKTIPKTKKTICFNAPATLQEEMGKGMMDNLAELQKQSERYVRGERMQLETSAAPIKDEGLRLVDKNLKLRNN